MKLFEQQVHPEADAIATFPDQLVWLGRGDRSATATAASLLISLASNPTTEELDFNLQLLGVLSILEF